MYWQWITGAVAAVLVAYFASEIGNGLTVFTDFVQVVYPLPYVNRMYEPTPASAAVKYERVQANVTTTKTIPFATPKEDDGAGWAKEDDGAGTAQEDDGAGTAKETAYKPILLPPRWRWFLTLVCNEVLQLMTALLILEGRMFLFLQQRLHLLVPLPVKGIETNSTGLKIRHLKKRLSAAKMQQLAEIASNAREERDSLKLALEEELDQARWEKDTETVLLKTVRNERDKLVKEFKEQIRGFELERDKLVKEFKEQIRGFELELVGKTLELKKKSLDVEEMQLHEGLLGEQITRMLINEERRDKKEKEQLAIINSLVERGKAFPAEEAVEDKGKEREAAGAGNEEKEVGEEKASADAGEKKKKRRRRRRHGKKGGAAAAQKAEEDGNGDEEEEKDHEE
ncbi:MAG: hypothetical protein Q9214_000551 [Letrouitia sp. 1 TL-2023]